MLALLALLALASANLPLHVVVFDKDMAVADLHSHITDVLGDVQNAKYIYTTALKGFAATLSVGAMAQIKAHPKFKYMEEDQVAHILGGEQTCSTQASSPSWGLPRVSERELSGATSYYYPDQAGEGVTSYVIDTGIYLAHNDFEGRATFGFKAEAGWSNTDGNGHGTHVASTVAGLQYGVAKKAKLVAVKVLSDQGSGSYAGVVAGCDWALAAYLAAKPTPGTANLSLGGPYFQALNDALDEAMQQGLFVVVAAGNSNADSCNDSPSSAPYVITVGSTDVSAANSDIRSYFSSYGPCVDVWGPGSDITGAWIGSPTASRTISGTSMASPHVCGVATLVYGANPDLKWDEVTSIITKGSNAVQGVVDLNCGSNTVCQQSPNSMIFNGCDE